MLNSGSPLPRAAPVDSSHKGRGERQVARRGYIFFTSVSVALTLIALYFIYLGAYPLQVPDEGRYVEIPREMLARHDFITPYLNGVKYFEKPPLFYWLQTLVIHFFGLKENMVRLVPIFFAGIGCAITHYTANILFDKKTGLLASIILGSALLYFALGHLITLDMALTALLSLTLFLFLLGEHAPKIHTRFILFLSSYAFAGLTMLTKGLIGIVFPAMIIGAWMCCLRDWRLVQRIYLLPGLLLFAVIVLPWHIAVQLKNPEFFQFYFIDQQVNRYATLSANRYRPIWFFIPILLLGFYPWSVFLIQTLYTSTQHVWKKLSVARTQLFLLLWVSIIFVFFSFSRSKLIPYILPIFPPLAILVAHYILHSPAKSLRWAMITLIPASLGVVLILWIVPHYFPTGPLTTKLLLPSAVLVPGVSLALYFQWYDARFKAVGVLAATTLLFLILMLPVIGKLDVRSVKPLAQTIKTLCPDCSTSQVVVYKRYYQDLPVYLGYPVTTVEVQDELAFGQQHTPDSPAWRLSDKTFWQRWQRPATLYMITPYRIYLQLRWPEQPNVNLLQHVGDNVLLSNHCPQDYQCISH